MPGTVFRECLRRNLELVYYMQILGSQVLCNFIYSIEMPQRSTIRHSPREIISTMCKTEQDTLRKRKRKPCRELFIHISNKSASNKVKNVSMESSKLNSLFEWNFVLFKILQVKNIPALHCKRAYFRRGWAQAMRPQSNLLQFMLKVAFN